MTAKQLTALNTKLADMIDMLNDLSNDSEYGSTLYEAINNAARSLENAQSIIDQEYN